MFKPSKTLLPQGKDSHFLGHLSDFVLSLCVKHQTRHEVRRSLQTPTLCIPEEVLRAVEMNTALSPNSSSCSQQAPGKEGLPFPQMCVSLKTPAVSQGPQGCPWSAQSCLVASEMLKVTPPGPDVILSTPILLLTPVSPAAPL